MEQFYVFQNAFNKEIHPGSDLYVYNLQWVAAVIRSVATYF